MKYVMKFIINSFKQVRTTMIGRNEVPRRRHFKCSLWNRGIACFNFYHLSSHTCLFPKHTSRIEHCAPKYLVWLRWQRPARQSHKKRYPTCGRRSRASVKNVRYWWLRHLLARLSHAEKICWPDFSSEARATMTKRFTF